MNIIYVFYENFKKIKLAKIKFVKGKQVVIKAKNAMGKTSLIEGILLLFRAIKITNPVNVDATNEKTQTEIVIGRNGEEQYKIKESRNKEGKTIKLSVIPLNGAPEIPSKGKTNWLSNLVSPLIADGLKFFEQSKDKKTEILKEMMGLDFTQLDNKQQKYAEERRYAGQKSKLLKEQLEDIADDFIGVPDTPVDVAKIQDELSILNQQKSDYINYTKNLENYKTEKINLLARMKELNEKLNHYEDNPVQDVEQSKFDELVEKMNNSNVINIRVSKKKDAIDLLAKVEEAKLQYDDFKERIEKIRDEKINLIKKAKTPVTGLTFCPDTGEILFEDIILDEVSKSQKINVSMQIAMAGVREGGLKVLMIQDGSLFDDEGLEKICKNASDKGFQIFIEKVDNSVETGNIEITADYEIEV